MTLLKSHVANSCHLLFISSVNQYKKYLMPIDTLVTEFSAQSHDESTIASDGSGAIMT
jgi:hypothetical protein